MINRCIVVLLSTVALSYPLASSARDSAPFRLWFQYLNAVAPGDNSALSGECDGATASPEVTCRFTRVVVRHQLDPKDASAELTKRITQMRSRAAKDPKNVIKRMCEEELKNRAEFERALKRAANPLTQEIARSFRALCDDPSLAALEDWVRRMTLAQARTCNVFVFQDDPVKFRKVGPHKWVANVGPTGLCKSVYLYTMELDAKASVGWKWSRLRTHADTSNASCKDLPLEYKLEYSWEGHLPGISCDVITFGLIH